LHLKKAAAEAVRLFHAPRYNIREMQANDLNHRLYDQPFRPFKVHLSDGSSIPVTNAGMVMVGETSVMLPVELGQDSEGFPLVKRWRTVALAHMVQFSDLDESVSGKNRKQK
jgi:hypothetical protein